MGGFKFVMMQSVGLAIYSLVTFLYNFKTYIGHYKPFWKFFSIKIILFLSIWQKIVLKFIQIDEIFILERTVLKRSLEPDDYIDGTLVCLEMFVLSILAIKNFSYTDFKHGQIQESRKSALTNMVALPMIL